ncbi:MAG: sulfite exporter TauE/SafE family protein [Chloroflexi bacterium]|nr:MAG: sulfite exporter TauE/SafE family protein [Chloroflexota bacterium]TMF01165.1 MAG: sulfite exporter TauE/SafE family protein [Chloroflexota bacterium]
MGPPARFSAIGFLGGFLGGLFGVGGGFVMIPLLVLWAGLGQRQANATSLVAIIPIAIAAVPIYYFRAGAPQVDLRVALFLVIGSMVGAYIGARALKRIPERQLRIGVAIVMVLVGIKQVVLP